MLMIDMGQHTTVTHNKNPVSQPHTWFFLMQWWNDELPKIVNIH